MNELRTGDRRLIRELNTSIVLDCIRRRGPIARTDIASLTGMGRSTVSGIVSFLLDRKLALPVGSGDSRGGRKPEMLAFNARRYFAVGLKIQPTSVVGCLCDLRGQILARSSAILSSQQKDSVVDAVVQVFDEVREGAGVEQLDDVLGAGIALPGLVDTKRGVSIHPHFFGWKDWEIRAELEDRLGVLVWVDNDARVGSLGENWARETEGSSFLFVTVGVGIGASLIVNGSLMDGELIGAGHLGHMRVSEERLPCRCGLHGCLETVAGDAALVRYAGLPPGSGVERVIELAAQGDPQAAAAVERASKYLAIAVGNVVKLLGVREVVIAGETAAIAGASYIARIQEQVDHEVFADLRGKVRVVPARLGNDVWLVGGAALVIDEVFRPPIYEDARSGARLISS